MLLLITTICFLSVLNLYLFLGILFGCGQTALHVEVGVGCQCNIICHHDGCQAPVLICLNLLLGAFSSCFQEHFVFAILVVFCRRTTALLSLAPQGTSQRAESHTTSLSTGYSIMCLDLSVGGSSDLGGGRGTRF